MVTLSEQKILTAEFSLEKMEALTTPEEKRKYFILNYFVPVALTTWQSAEFNSGYDWCALHICKAGSFFFPQISQLQEEDRELVIGNRDVSGDSSVRLAQNYTSSVGTPGEHVLSQQLKLAFENCMPQSTTDYPRINELPLVATLYRKDSGQGQYDIQLNIITKTRGSVGNPLLLLNKGHHRYSKLLLAASDKYQRAYVTLTGEWLGLCNEGECNECDLIYKSPARKSAYDEPEAVQ